MLGKNWQVNLLSRLFNGVTIGYAREYISRLLLSKYAIYNDVKRYQCLYYLDLLKASGLAEPDYVDISMDLAIPDSDKAFVDHALDEYKLGKFDIVVNSGGNNQYESGGIRMLPTNKVVELLQKLSAAGHKVILMGGGIDKQNYNNYLTQVPVGLLNCAGMFNLPQSVYLISQAQHFYTTDCGAMHLGVIAAIGKKMTCFFGPTCPWHILPVGSQADIIWNDSDVFNKDYQLRGKVEQQAYFLTLEVDKALKL